MKEEGYPVNRWTLDVIGGAKKEKGALDGLKEDDKSRGHLFDHFVTEAGTSFQLIGDITTAGTDDEQRCPRI